MNKYKSNFYDGIICYYIALAEKYYKVYQIMYIMAITTIYDAASTSHSSFGEE